MKCKSVCPECGGTCCKGSNHEGYHNHGTRTGRTGNSIEIHTGVTSFNRSDKGCNRKSWKYSLMDWIQ